MDGSFQDAASSPSLSVERLLSLPFEAALQQCPALQAYIAANSDGDTTELMEEFKRHWSPSDAPPELMLILETVLRQGFVTVEDLLSMPFDDALQKCPALTTYIEEKAEGDIASLSDEFRSQWSANAPVELRQVLEEILGLEPSGASASDSTLNNDALGIDIGIESEPFAERSHSPVSDADRSLHAADSGSVLGGVHRPSEVDVEDSADDTEQEQYWLDLSAKVDALLALPFDQALERCPELAQYIAAQENPDEVSVEFSQRWGDPQLVPAELRTVLEELLSPDLAAVNAAETEAFMSRMAATNEDAKVEKNDGGDMRRSRL